MQLKHLKTFMAVADTLSLTRAGERLHLAQSSVSEQIQALELDLGAGLFDRSRRRLALTPAGQRLVDYAAGILTLTDEARAAMAEETGKVAGRIAIGGIDSLCLARLPALILRYCTAFPAVQVMLRPGRTPELHGGLKAGLLDLYFTFGMVAGEPGLSSEVLGREPVVLAAPPNHRLAGRLAGGDAVTTGDLAGEPFLVTIPGCPTRAAFDAVFAAQPTARPRIVGEFASVAAMRTLVEAGGGCAFMPRTAAEDSLATGRLIALPWRSPVDIPVSMAWRRRRRLPSALAHFLEAARAAPAAAA